MLTINDIDANPDPDHLVEEMTEIVTAEETRGDLQDLAQEIDAAEDMQVALIPEASASTVAQFLLVEVAVTAREFLPMPIVMAREPLLTAAAIEREHLPMAVVTEREPPPAVIIRKPPPPSKIREATLLKEEREVSL
jgi:hypothetical protein